MKKLVVYLMVVIRMSSITTTTIENSSDNNFVKNNNVSESSEADEEEFRSDENFCNVIDVIIFDKHLNETAVDVETLDSVDFLSKKIKRHASELPNDYQRSLLIIFDGTGSMFDDLEQLKQGAKQIIAELATYQDSPIFNYVLVIFRDPSK